MILLFLLFTFVIAVVCVTIGKMHEEKTNKHISPEKLVKLDNTPEALELTNKVLNEVLKPFIDAYLAVNIPNIPPKKTPNKSGLALTISLSSDVKSVLDSLNKCCGLKGIEKDLKNYIESKYPYVNMVRLVGYRCDPCPVDMIQIFTQPMTDKELLEYKINKYNSKNNK